MQLHNNDADNDDEHEDDDNDDNDGDGDDDNDPDADCGTEILLMDLSHLPLQHNKSFKIDATPQQ